MPDYGNGFGRYGSYGDLKSLIIFDLYLILLRYTYIKQFMNVVIQKNKSLEKMIKIKNSKEYNIF